MSHRTVLVERVVQLLQAEAGADHVHQDALLPIEKDILPAYVVYPTKVSVTETSQTWGLREYEMDLRVEVRAIGEPYSTVLDPMISLVKRVLLTEPFLEGVALNVKEGDVQYDAASADQVYGAAACDFVIRYYEDPTGQGPDPLEPPPFGVLTQLDVQETFEASIPNV